MSGLPSATGEAAVDNKTTATVTVAGFSIYAGVTYLCHASSVVKDWLRRAVGKNIAGQVYDMYNVLSCS